MRSSLGEAGAIVKAAHTLWHDEKRGRGWPRPLWGKPWVASPSDRPLSYLTVAPCRAAPRMSSASVGTVKETATVLPVPSS